MADLEKFTQLVHGNHFIPNTVLVDCTADSNVASCYHDWLRRGIHVITPNKKANSGPLDQVTKFFHLWDMIIHHHHHHCHIEASSVVLLFWGKVQHSRFFKINLHYRYTS